MAMGMAVIVPHQSLPKVVRRRSSFMRRSAKEWGVRGVLALVAVGLGSVSIANSLADVIKENDPARAHLLAPGNGKITALLAEKRLGDAAARHAMSETMQLARLAVRQDPTAVQAVTTLGMQAMMQHNPTMAGRLFTYSQHLSRRDLQTQIWAIEDAVTRGNVPDALRHYDIALRTSKRAPDLLFPVLSKAIANTDVRTGLVAILANRPVWGPQFINYLANSNGSPQVSASLLAHLQHAGVQAPGDAVSAVINGLLTEQAFDLAWRFYASVRPGVDRRRSRNPQFHSDVATPSQFDWTPVNDAGINTSIQRDGQHGIFEFSVPPSVGGTLLTQLQMLPPGRYDLKGHTTGIDQNKQSLPFWIVTCRDGRALGRVEVPNSAQEDGVFSGQVQIPGDCPVQTLAFVARSSDGIAGSAGQVDRVQLSPAT